MPYFILFSRDIALLSLVFQCCMDYNKFIFFFHYTYTPHMHALWIVPSAQCQFACKQLTNKQTNKSLQQMSDTDSEMNGVTNAMEAAEIAGEFKLRALNNNKLFYFSKIIIQKTQLCAARRFRQCAIIDNTNFMTCTRLHPNYNTNLPLDGVKEENERAATPTQRNPMSRAPTPEPTPTTDPTPTPDPDPSTHQNHTHPPGPEPLPLSANLAPRTRLDSACSGVSVASRQGPKDKGDRAPLSEQARLARRNKDRKKRKMKRQEQTANKRENKDPGQLADAKSQEEVAESQPVCSGEPNKNNNNNNNPTTNPPTHPPTHQPTHQPTHPQTPPPPAYDPPVRSTVR